MNSSPLRRALRRLPCELGSQVGVHQKWALSQLGTAHKTVLGTPSKKCGGFSVVNFSRFSPRKSLNLHRTLHNKEICHLNFAEGGGGHSLGGEPPAEARHEKYSLNFCEFWCAEPWDFCTSPKNSTPNFTKNFAPGLPPSKMETSPKTSLCRNPFLSGCRQKLPEGRQNKEFDHSFSISVTFLSLFCCFFRHFFCQTPFGGLPFAAGCYRKRQFSEEVRASQ